MTDNLEKDAISEALDYDMVENLKDSKGRDLGPLKVPYLASIPAIRLQGRVIAQYMKVMNVNKDDAAAVVKAIYDEEGIQLQVDLIKSALSISESELNQRFSVDSLNKIYSFILKRDFKMDDLMKAFTDRFGGLFGGTTEGEVPPTPTAS